jgi:hypothetical protein
MDEPNRFEASRWHSPHSGDCAGPTDAHEERLRRNLLRRLRLLVAVGGVAFVLTTWMLVRTPNPASLFFATAGRGPLTVVQSYFEALNHGELRTAYDLFSPQYRGQVPFEAYHALVVSHRRMFLTREVQVRDSEVSTGRTVLVTRLVTTDGERYLARFTLVRLGGRWWIDDLRWAAEPSQHNIISI